MSLHRQIYSGHHPTSLASLTILRQYSFVYQLLGQTAEKAATISRPACKHPEASGWLMLETGTLVHMNICHDPSRQFLKCSDASIQMQMFHTEHSFVLSASEADLPCQIIGLCSPLPPIPTGSLPSRASSREESFLALQSF